MVEYPTVGDSHNVLDERITQYQQQIDLKLPAKSIGSRLVVNMQRFHFDVNTSLEVLDYATKRLELHTENMQYKKGYEGINDEAISDLPRHLSIVEKGSLELILHNLTKNLDFDLTELNLTRHFSFYRKLGQDDKGLIVCRDRFYNGSWQNLLASVRLPDSSKITRIPLKLAKLKKKLKKLWQYEKDQQVNLGKVAQLYDFLHQKL